MKIFLRYYDKNMNPKTRKINRRGFLNFRTAEVPKNFIVHGIRVTDCPRMWGCNITNPNEQVVIIEARRIIL